MRRLVCKTLELGPPLINELHSEADDIQQTEEDNARFIYEG